MKRTKYYRPANRDYMKKEDKAEWGFVVIVMLAAFALLLGHKAEACDEVYLKVGSSYKAQTSTVVHTHAGLRKVDDTDKFGARFELGVQSGNWSYGVAHYSQWLSGAPFNDKKEPYRTELFIDYKFTLWGS